MICGREKEDHQKEGEKAAVSMSVGGTLCVEEAAKAVEVVVVVEW